MIAQGFFVDGSFDPAGVAEVLARPRTHRVLWFTLWSAAAGHAGQRRCWGCRRRTCCTGWRFPFRDVVRALLLVPFVLPTVVVGRRVPAAGGGVRAAGLPRPGRDAGRDHRRPHLLQRRRRDPRGRRRLGVARPAAGRGGRGARREPGPGVPHGHLPGPAAGAGGRRERGVPLLRHVVRRGADPRRAALLLGRDRDLPAHHPAARPAGGRRALDPPAARDHRAPGPRRPAPSRARPDRRASYGAARGGPGGRTRPSVALTLLVLVLVAAPILTLVVGSLRADDALEARELPPAHHRRRGQRAAGPGHRRAGHLAADRGGRDLDGAAARRVDRGRGQPPLAHPRRTPAAQHASTASSCCRSASPR